MCIDCNVMLSVVSHETMNYFMQHAIAHAKDDVLASSGVSVTDVSWVMVITWSKMLPRMYRSRHDSVSRQ